MSLAAPVSLTHAPAEAARGSSATGFWLLAALAALVGAGKAITADTLDPDAFWHLRVADQLATDGVGPLVDRISFASIKTPWTPYSWLGELLMRVVWNAGGFQLATLVTALCSAAIVLLIGGAARQAARRDDGSTNDVAAALLTFVAAWFTLPFLSFRPVTFALVLMAAIVWLLVRDRRKPTAWVWAAVPMTAVITNLHLYAGIMVALVWLTAAADLVTGKVNTTVPRRREKEGEQDENREALACLSPFSARASWRHGVQQIVSSRPILLAIAVTLAACCTPMLRGAVATALSYNGGDPMVASPFITEMRPFYTGPSGKVSLGLFVVLAVVCVTGRRRLSWADWLWLGLGTLLLFRLGRFSPVFAMLAIPACARAMPALRGRVLSKPLIHVVLGLVIAAGVVNLAPSFGERDLDRWLNRNTPAYPTAAAAFVDAMVPPRSGRLINEFNWGGYLAWRLGDRYQVLLDGRTQLYTPDFWRQTHLGEAAARRAFLKGMVADAAVLPVHESAFENTLRDLGWCEVFRDELAVVLVPGA